MTDGCLRCQTGHLLAAFPTHDCVGHLPLLLVLCRRRGLKTVSPAPPPIGAHCRCSAMHNPTNQRHPRASLRGVSAQMRPGDPGLNFHEHKHFGSTKIQTWIPAFAGMTTEFKTISPPSVDGRLGQEDGSEYR